MKYIASITCGKNSLAMLIKIIENPDKYPLDEIVLCEVMATSTQSASFELHRQFIEKTIPVIEKMAKVPVKIIKAETNFEEQFYKKKGARAKVPNSIYGFPMTICAWCNDRLKMKPLDKYFKSQGEHIRYLGLAYDEPKRIARLKKNEIAPLYELGITDKDSKQICIQHNLLSPIYKYFDREGCWFCPKQSIKALKTVYEKFPKYWNKLRDWQKDSPVPFKPNLTIFDLEKKIKGGEKMRLQEKFTEAQYNECIEKIKRKEYFTVEIKDKRFRFLFSCEYCNNGCWVDNQRIGVAFTAGCSGYCYGMPVNAIDSYAKICYISNRRLMADRLDGTNYKKPIKLSTVIKIKKLLKDNADKYLIRDLLLDTVGNEASQNQIISIIKNGSAEAFCKGICAELKAIGYEVV